MKNIKTKKKRCIMIKKKVHFSGKRVIVQTLNKTVQKIHKNLKDLFDLIVPRDLFKKRSQ